MVPPPPIETPKREEGNNDDDDKNSPSSSWFGSWFERDLRNEIHEQLDDFEERKQKYEETQEERRKFFEQHAASSSFPFFFSPSVTDHPLHPFGTGDDSTSSRRRRSNPNERHRDEFEDFFGGFPGGPWQGGFHGDDSGDERRRRRRGPFEHDGNGGNHHSQTQRDRGIEELHREMQILFESLQGHGGHHRGGGGNQGWTSSSSTTVISNSNGTSYTMKQDPKNGARIDLRLPKSCPSEKVSVEVLRERPCLFRWRNIDAETGDAIASPTRRNHQVLELGDAVDCSKLSASISKAKQTLTVEAPPIGRRTSDREEDPSSLSHSQQPHGHPRPVPVTKKS